jgi:phosphatidylglycerophosphatase A
MPANTIPTAPALAPLTQPGWRFLMEHPAHFIALGAGSGLSRVAPSTDGTLWAWAAFLILQPFTTDRAWALLIVLGTLVGW